MDYRRTDVWTKAMRLAELACREVIRMPALQRTTMGTQILRSATSVASNIAEGWARDSPREKCRFLSIAHGSLDELNTQLLLSARLGWIDEVRATTMFELYEDVGSMLTKLRRYLSRSPASAASRATRATSNE